VKIGRSNVQPRTTKILTRKRRDEQDALEGQNATLLTKLLRRHEGRKTRRDVSVGVDRRKRRRRAVKRRRTPDVLLDAQRVREKMPIVKLLKPKKLNARKGVAPGRLLNAKLMLSLDRQIVDDLRWMLMMMKSVAEDVKSDAQGVTARPRGQAVASLLQSSTTTSLLKAQCTRTGRKIRRERRRAGHTQELIHGFKTILTPRRHQKMLRLSTTSLLRTKSVAADGSRVDTRNMTMSLKMTKKSVDEDASPDAPREIR
jgi:hypothetical protein